MIMYNQTIKFFKKQKTTNDKIKLNFMEIRTKYMKEIKENIYKTTGIPSHTLDYAIKDACTMYKSALTNIKNKNIKHFRLRYIKKNKCSKIIKLEKTSFSKNKKTFCKKLLGNEMKASKEFNVTCDCTLQYKYGKFILLSPIKIQKSKEKTKKYPTISIDPGIRTPYMGYSENHVIEIGSNYEEKIGSYIKQIDKINGSSISQGKKRIAVSKRYERIENLVNELHWKTIDYITKNYSTVLIGNLSTSKIVKNNLSSITKRLAHLMRLYVFECRLKYKCYLTSTKYKKVNEEYTSKICSNCGNVKEDLGKAKIYECKECKITIGRDVNGAKNIYMVNMKE